MARAYLLLVAVLVWSWILHIRSIVGLCRSVSGVFTLTSLGVALVALRRGDKPGMGALNAWDEALVLTCVAVLARVLGHLHASF